MRLQVAVSVGLTVEQIAAAVEMSRRSVYCHFKDELATGRAKRLLANAVRLDAMAEAGNVSAAKYLHSLMMDHPESEADDDQWADVVGVNFCTKSGIWENELMAKPKRDLRAMRRAAMAGDQSAAKALLRLYGFGAIAQEIKAGKPSQPACAMP